MDLHTAIRERRSCRKYLPDPLSRETIDQLLEAENRAPSPANNHPWEFMVVTSGALKEKIFAEAGAQDDPFRNRAGWKWLNRYEVHFLKEVPVILAVVGDPKKTGADMFLKEGGQAYQHACAAAIQNILLTAHSLSLSGEPLVHPVREGPRSGISIEAEKDPIALICLGKPSKETVPTPRKSVQEKTAYR